MRLKKMLQSLQKVPKMGSWLAMASQGSGSKNILIRSKKETIVTIINNQLKGVYID